MKMRRIRKTPILKYYEPAMTNFSQEIGKGFSVDGKRKDIEKKKKTCPEKREILKIQQ